MESIDRQLESEEISKLGRLHADLLLVVAALAITVLSVVVDVSSIVRAPLALLLVFFIPGYALTMALFPVGDLALPAGLVRTTKGDGITVLDRIILSVGLSIGIVILVGVAVNALGIPLATGPLLSALTIVTAGLLPASFYRRMQTVPHKRFVPFPEGSFDRLSRWIGNIDTLGVVLVVSVLFAGGAVAVSAGMDGGSGATTEFYFLTADGNGSLQADDYPTEFTRGEGQPLSVAVGNHEGRTATYTVVGQLQRAQQVHNSTVVQERQQIHSSAMTVSADETRTRNMTVTPTETGEYRLTYLLYLDDPPASPTEENAYREIHLWIEVEPPAAGG